MNFRRRTAATLANKETLYNEIEMEIFELEKKADRLEKVRYELILICGKATANNK